MSVQQWGQYDLNLQKSNIFKKSIVYLAYFKAELTSVMDVSSLERKTLKKSKN